jgi:diguanylate cyclase (GGDEF)-like protein
MTAGNPTTPLCDQFGLDASWRSAQLMLVGLDDFSNEQVCRLHERVLDRDTTQQLVDRFYQLVLRHPQAAELLASFDIEHLKQRQVQYFTELGVNFSSAGYFESRARVGVAHARVGVPLSLYLGAFGLLQSLILDAVQARAGEEQGMLCRLVARLVSLDITLATEVYHRASVADMDRSLKRLEKAQQNLREQLERDTLTGVSSRTSLLHELQQAIERASKTGQPLVVMMADLDHFKQVNDAHGHLVGDQVLQEVAARIRAALREFDLVGRYGGEEFVILLENTSAHTAQQIALRIRQRIAQEPIQLGDLSLHVTLSQGLTLRVEGDTQQSLLQRADQAMYKAKHSGRNCVVSD